jgi:excisionase family DNA binding protein
LDTRKGLLVSGITLTLDGIEPLLARLVEEAVEQKLAALKDDRPMDSKAAAEYLGVSRRRIHDLVNEGRLPRRSDGPGCKLWFSKADLDTYMGA